jgi:hypothetical protein
MMTRTRILLGLIVASLLFGGWGLSRARGQDEKPENGRPSVDPAAPNDPDARPQFADRRPGGPQNLDPGAPNPGAAGFDPSVPRDPNTQRGARGDGRGGPPGYRGQFSPGSPMPFRPFPGMSPNDPETEKLMRTDMELDRQSRELAEHFRGAAKDEQAEIKKKLAEVVTKQFEARQERRTLELKRLEDEIKRIRESIDKRNQGKEQIVDRRVSELLGQDDNSF